MNLNCNTCKDIDEKIKFMEWWSDEHEWHCSGDLNLDGRRECNMCKDWDKDYKEINEEKNIHELDHQKSIKIN